jgi:putative methyltransferase
MVRAREGTAKALCLRKEMEKKKQTYAVVCETLRHYELLEAVLLQSEFFQYYPQASRDLAMVLAYDEVLGKRVKTKTDATARAISQSGPYLREAYHRVKKHHVIVPRRKEDSDISQEGDQKKNSSGLVALPRYGRVNTLKISRDDLAEILRRVKRPREESDDAYAAQKRPEQVDNQKQQHRKRRPSTNQQHTPIVFEYDEHIPDLLVFPPSTDLHNHPSVRRGQLILQDKSSCLPACVLLDAVPVEVAPGVFTATVKYIIDACAAPGNKTTQLAALGVKNLKTDETQENKEGSPDYVKILALERDTGRAGTLLNRVRSLGASEYITCANQDFLKISSEDREAAEAILLDPSCSSSGVISRVDVSLEYDRPKALEEAVARGDTAIPVGRHNNKGKEEEEKGGKFQDLEISSTQSRIEQLARAQRKLLLHSLISFPNCRRVVYSTCSIHEEENEEVVRLVLADERVQKLGWGLSNIMPWTWRTRGISKAEDTVPLVFTIRCDPSVDRTNGFFVARFDRVLPNNVASSDFEEVGETG